MNIPKTNDALPFLTTAQMIEVLHTLLLLGDSPDDPELVPFPTSRFLARHA